MFVINLKNYRDLASLRIIECNDSATTQYIYLSEHCGFKDDKEFNKILIDRFNATLVNIDKLLDNRPAFKNKEDAEAAIEWIQSQILIQKLTGKFK